MATTVPALRITSGVALTAGYWTYLGNTTPINAAQNRYLSFINGASPAASAFRITEYGVTRGTLAAAATVEIDLFDGTLKNPNGQDVVFNTLKLAAIFLTNSSYDIGGTGTAGILRIGNASTNGNSLWFNAIGNMQLIYPFGPPFMQGSPTGVTVNGTNKKVKLENTHGTDALYYVAVFGGLI